MVVVVLTIIGEYPVNCMSRIVYPYQILSLGIVCSWWPLIQYMSNVNLAQHRNSGWDCSGANSSRQPSHSPCDDSHVHPYFGGCWPVGTHWSTHERPSPWSGLRNSNLTCLHDGQNRQCILLLSSPAFCISALCTQICVVNMWKWFKTRLFITTMRTWNKVNMVLATMSIRPCIDWPTLAGWWGQYHFHVFTFPWLLSWFCI